MDSRTRGLFLYSGLGARDSGLGIQDQGLSPVREVAPIIPDAPPRITVAAAIASEDAGLVSRLVPASDRLVGTLVHRLLQRAGFGPLAPDAVRDLAARLVRAEEIDESGDLDAVVDAAAAAYAAICTGDDVRQLYESGRRFHELPFTMTDATRVIRGTIDCLVETAPGRLTLLEFKTGRPRPQDQVQVDFYLTAIRQLFPGAQIDARLVYAGPTRRAERPV